MGVMVAFWFVVPPPMGGMAGVVDAGVADKELADEELAA
jgi:hypothetical protein